MTIEEARLMYLADAATALYSCNSSRRYREHRWLLVDAASVAYDLAVAQESEDRTRRGVAWG